MDTIHTIHIVPNVLIHTQFNEKNIILSYDFDESNRNVADTC